MLRFVFRLTFASMLLAGPAAAGPGHDHGAGHGGAESGPAQKLPRLESIGTDIELVAIAEGRKLTIYLDRIVTNEPVDNAEIEISGEAIPAAKAKRVSVGTYEVRNDWVGTPGVKALLFIVTADGIADLLNGTLSIPEHEHAALGARTPLREIILRPDILGIMFGTLALGFVLALAVRRPLQTPRQSSTEHAERDKKRPSDHVPLKGAAGIALIVFIASATLISPVLAGPGHDHGDNHGAGPVTDTGNVPRKLPDGSIFLPKPTQRLLQVRTREALEATAARTLELFGTVVPDPSAFGLVQAPMDGQIEVTGRGIFYVGQNVEAGDVLALLSPTIPLADLGTMQQLRAEIEGKLKIAEQRLARLTRIANVVAQRDIEDTKAELDALHEQKRVLAPKDIEKVKLKAPVSGMISVAKVNPGQVVSARDTLFEIVDPKRLWVEGFGTDAHANSDVVAANALDSEGHAIELEYVGRSPTLRQQARPFLFRMKDIHAGVAIGAPVKILVQTKQTTTGFILPAEAVVRGLNGLLQVWVKVSPEHFRPVPVRTLQIDGARTVATAGLEPGERVVVSGAELINQIR
jgi:membrane fusion protein, heavy metal efflux system